MWTFKRKDEMLNISKNSIDKDFPMLGLRSFGMLENPWARRRTLRSVGVLLLLALAAMWLPWTQYVRARGAVTNLRADRRPQALMAAIPGRIAAWYVQEGDAVQAGDTLVRISEVKEEYADPALLERTAEKLAAAEGQRDAYAAGLEAYALRQEAVEANRDLDLSVAAQKIEQARLKVAADSAKATAARLDAEVARTRLDRREALYAEGLASLTDLEARRLENRKNAAALTAADAEWTASRAALTAAELTRSAKRREYADKLAKLAVDRAKAEADLAGGEAKVAELRNQLANYEAREGFRYVLAPQAGRIARALTLGLGETVSAGDALVTIVPDDGLRAVEMYVDPMDLPLLHVGGEVRFLFDGWPAVFFSGWPRLQYGTFPGEIVAIDRMIGDNGKYRILVAEPAGAPWPEALRAGSGARGIALLEQVSVGYELWRQFNGFPQDFYSGPDTSEDGPKGKVKKRIGK